MAIHEAEDQSGTLLGPPPVAGMIALSRYRLGFAVLGALGVLAVVTLRWLHGRVSQPSAYEALHAHAATRGGTAASAPLPARFWLYTGFTAASVAGFAIFGVLSYHMEVRHVLPSAMIPVTSTAAMAAAVLAALGSAYGWIGLRGLVIALPLTATIPALSLSMNPPLIWIGAVVWGAAVGLLGRPCERRLPTWCPQPDAAPDTAHSPPPMAWLGGSDVIGSIYGRSKMAVTLFVVATQIVALVLFLPLAFRTAHAR